MKYLVLRCLKIFNNLKVISNLIQVFHSLDDGSINADFLIIVNLLELTPRLCISTPSELQFKLLILCIIYWSTEMRRSSFNIMPSSRSHQIGSEAGKVRRRRRQKKMAKIPYRPSWNDRFMIEDKVTHENPHVMTMTNNKTVEIDSSIKEGCNTGVQECNEHLLSFTERSDGIPQMTTYGDKRGINNDKVMVNRSCSPIDLKLVTRALDKSLKIREGNLDTHLCTASIELDLKQAYTPTPAEIER